jgi:hypothetical protein
MSVARGLLLTRTPVVSSADKRTMPSPYSAARTTTTAPVEWGFGTSQEQTCAMNNLPSDVLRHLAAAFLNDDEACRFSQTSMHRRIQLTLRSRDVLKEPIPAVRWKEIAPP